MAKVAGPSTQSPMTKDGTSPRMFLISATPLLLTTRQIVAFSGSATKAERSSVAESLSCVAMPSGTPRGMAA